jgi:hypothetical protein
MKKRPLFLKIIAIANALLVTAVFVGCPDRQEVVPNAIAPPPIDPNLLHPAKDPPPPPPFVTIAPYGGNVPFFPQNPPPANQDPKNDKRSPNQ